MPEIIWDTKKGFDFTESIKPDIIQTPNYDYWTSQEPLDYELLRNKPSASWGQYKLWNFTITWTWNISITWVWFTPKLVKFTIWDSSWNIWGWIWSMTSLSQQCYNITNSVNITSQCIYYWNPIWARAVYVNMNNDWFVINCTYFSRNTYVLYECYG